MFIFSSARSATSAVQLRFYGAKRAIGAPISKNPARWTLTNVTPRLVRALRAPPALLITGGQVFLHFDGREDHLAPQRLFTVDKTGRGVPAKGRAAACGQCGDNFG